MMIRRLFWLVPLVLAACQATAPASNMLTVFAAASLTNTFTDIGKAFESANPNTKVVFNFAGSQDLRTQIEQGARADVFASADMSNMEQLQSKSLTQGDARVFTRNRLVVIVPKSNRLEITELDELAKPSVKLVLADASVPVGNYSLQVLDKLSTDPILGVDFKARVLAHVVSRENNVRQVASKVALGEADAGIVYATDAQSLADRLTIIEIPDAFNVIATYPIAVLKDSTNAPLAEKFIAFVLSVDGQAILSKYGFTPP